MTGSELYSEIKTWQTGIASLLGFTGLIVGALWNFHLNRKRDAYIRSEEIRSTAAALYGEVILLREEIGRVGNSVAHMYWRDKRDYETSPFIDDDFLRSNRLSKPFIFEALAGKLGILPTDMVLGLSKFYQNFREAEYFLPLLRRTEDHKVNYSAAYVLEPARDAVRDIEPTLVAIEKILKISPTRRKIMVKDVDDVIELERQFFED